MRPLDLVLNQGERSEPRGEVLKEFNPLLSWTGKDSNPPRRGIPLFVTVPVGKPNREGIEPSHHTAWMPESNRLPFRTVLAVQYLPLNQGIAALPVLRGG